MQTRGPRFTPTLVICSAKALNRPMSFDRSHTRQSLIMLRVAPQSFYTFIQQPLSGGLLSAKPCMGHGDMQKGHYVEGAHIPRGARWSKGCRKLARRSRPMEGQAGSS